MIQQAGRNACYTSKKWKEHRDIFRVERAAVFTAFKSFGHIGTLEPRFFAVQLDQQVPVGIGHVFKSAEAVFEPLPSLLGAFREPGSRLPALKGKPFIHLRGVAVQHIQFFLYNLVDVRSPRWVQNGVGFWNVSLR